jgi:hypothetical protein
LRERQELAEKTPWVNEFYTRRAIERAVYDSIKFGSRLECRLGDYYIERQSKFVFIFRRESEVTRVRLEGCVKEEFKCCICKRKEVSRKAIKLTERLS